MNELIETLEYAKVQVSKHEKEFNNPVNFANILIDLSEMVELLKRNEKMMSLYIEPPQKRKLFIAFISERIMEEVI